VAFSGQYPSIHLEPLYTFLESMLIIDYCGFFPLNVFNFVLASTPKDLIHHVTNQNSLG